MWCLSHRLKASVKPYFTLGRENACAGDCRCNHTPNSVQKNTPYNLQTDTKVTLILVTWGHSSVCKKLYVKPRAEVTQRLGVCSAASGTALIRSRTCPS